MRVLPTDYENLMKTDRSKALKKATEEFVAYFFYQMFKEMWDSIPRSGLLPETLGERMFRDMLLYEYSKKVASQDASNLTRMIMKSLGVKEYSGNDSKRF